MARWSWGAGSVVGTAHAAGGEARQDAFRVLSPGRGRHLVATVCDGAGSAPLGGQGARLAAWSVSGSAASWLTRTSRLPSSVELARWVLLARIRIMLKAARAGRDGRDFATTLVTAVSDGDRTITAHVGDGAVFARVAGAWSVLSWPEHGEHASTTRFVTDDGPPALRIATHEALVDRLVMMTDGLERLAIDFRARAPHAAFLDPLADALDDQPAGRSRKLCGDIDAFLSGDRVNDRTDDDKTLVITGLL